MRKRMKLTDTKILVSGSTLEVYLYIDRKLSYNYIVPQSPNRVRSRIEVVDEKTKEQKRRSREKSMARARSKLRRLVNANAWKWKRVNGTPYTPKFVTLTFADNLHDIKEVNLLFSLFIKRLNYSESGKESFLKYVVVTEFQQRGAVHFHIIFFNLEYIWGDDLRDIWKHGITHIRNIDNVSNAGAYVCKYMGKGFQDERLDGKKRYFSSRGLIKPVEIKREHDARKILNEIPKEFLKQNKIYKDVSDNRIQYLAFQVDKRDSFVDVVPYLKYFL
ncbi:MAG: hypothetical protein RLZZ308_649 [Candidatus Parcubacteria bacterium]